MPLVPGARLGPYEVVAPLGAGGMGEVYRATDTRLDRSVAVKILSVAFANDAQLKIRFEREAKAISSLSHPNICLSILLTAVLFFASRTVAADMEKRDRGGS